MIVDTGVFVAAANDSEPDHPACASLLAEATGALIVPAMVIAEATFMIERAGGPPLRRGSFARFAPPRTSSRHPLPRI